MRKKWCKTSIVRTLNFITKKLILFFVTEEVVKHEMN